MIDLLSPHYPPQLWIGEFFRGSLGSAIGQKAYTTFASLRLVGGRLDLRLEVEEPLALLTWSHECIVGVKAMDDQHGIIMDTMNDLRLMILQGRERKSICGQLERLIELTQMHFQSEEQLLEKQGFPGLAEHRQAHHCLLTQIQTKLEHTRHSEDVEVAALFQFLRGWYMDHIEKLDQAYGSWLNARGVY